MVLLRPQLRISTEFGAFLDPVADKLMVSTALILLATSPPEPVSRPAMVVPVLVIIGREITMSSLREWAAASNGGAHKVGMPRFRCKPRPGRNSSAESQDTAATASTSRSSARRRMRVRGAGPLWNH